MYNQVSCAELLLKFGARVDAMDDFNRDAMEYAKVYKHTAIIKLLKDYNHILRENKAAASSSSVFECYHAK